MLTFPLFFVKIVYMLAYVYFFIVPSDAALTLRHNTILPKPIPPKLRSHDAAYVQGHSNFISKIGVALSCPFLLSLL